VKHIGSNTAKVAIRRILKIEESVWTVVIIVALLMIAATIVGMLKSYKRHTKFKEENSIKVNGGH